MYVSEPCSFSLVVQLLYCSPVGVVTRCGGRGIFHNCPITSQCSRRPFPLVLWDVQSLQWLCAVCFISQLCLTLCDLVECSPPGSPVHGDSPGKKTGVGCHALLQGIFPTQGENQVSHSADRFSTSEPPGKPVTYFICSSFPYIVPWLWCFQYIFIEDMTSVDNLRDDWKATQRSRMWRMPFP